MATTSDPTAPQTRQEPISVSSDVLARLGEELITNHIQALAELIKNSYDADATIVNVTVDTTRLIQDDQGRTRKGMITVADNGFGMDEDAVRTGWLRVSASRKRAMKAEGRQTPGQRTPLGDKGLGRLGAQRLGDRMRIRTRPETRTDGVTVEGATVEHDVAFAFSDFSTDLDVSGIRVPWKTYSLPEQQALPEPWPLKKQTGTVLEVSGLRNADDWADHQVLERELSLLVNPFKGLEKFRLSVTVDGHRLNLSSVAEKVRSAALARWEGMFDGETMSVEGRISARWFNVRDPHMRQMLMEAVEADRGKGLQDFILEHIADEKFSLMGGDKGWLIIVKREFSLAEIDPKGLVLEGEEDADTDEEVDVDLPGAAGAQAKGRTESVTLPDRLAAQNAETPSQEPRPRTPLSPGEFLYEIDVVSRRIGVIRAGGVSAFDRQGQYTNWLNERGGVHVYRDGFRINLGTDVMQLGEAFSSSSSYYGLRPQNVIGYIQISARENPGLEETTDREGFRDTPEVLTFRRLIRLLRDDINDVLDEVGRQGLEYARAQLASEDDTVEDLADDLEAAAVEAADSKVALAEAQSFVSAALNSPSNDLATREDALRKANEALRRAESAVDAVRVASRLGQAARFDVQQMSERMEEYAQLIGLGLVAETLAHELSGVSARLSGQVSELQRRTDLQPWARAYLQEVRSALDALRGQLRHLDPMLRYARTRREDIALDVFARQMADFHAPRLRQKLIEITVSASDAATVRGNRGRLMQVFDNLIINSEYWLEQALRTQRIARGKIEVDVSGPVLRVRDNGPGVDKPFEAKIFEPFVTTKSDRGRGLGLFISAQLLDLEEATIRLGDHRNREGRADTFEIEFNSGAQGIEA